ncbi:MAG TPA: PhzF family phenazine biosynthesis protein [Acidimicrobiia bacterium]|nr:PhzF family phenazine biosynthesis protein [Acidimicrobiia bacterium]
MSFPLFQVDAFTDERFRGNPAAVCLLDRPVTAAWMQSVAAEMNLAETAFVLPLDDVLTLRWFTPTTEVPLCGHATLATAHVLWETDRIAADEDATFSTLSGALRCRRDDERIAMDFPAETPVPEVATVTPVRLDDALRGTARDVVRGTNHYLVELDDEATVRGLRPNLDVLAKLDANGVIVTARADDDRFDFVSRYFAPRVGIPEDPVTGAAHCMLGPWWAERLGKIELVGHQVSARGGVVRVRVDGTRVELSGSAVTVLRGELL